MEKNVKTNFKSVYWKSEEVNSGCLDRTSFGNDITDIVRASDHGIKGTLDVLGGIEDIFGTKIDTEKGAQGVGA